MAQIEANLHWNDTGFQLTEGKRYRVEVSGQWVDKNTSCDARGYQSGSNLVLKLSEWLRRVPEANWFELIGGIDCESSSVFRFGQDFTFRAERTGVLTCFANDVYFMYGNNSGALDLEVLELPDPGPTAPG